MSVDDALQLAKRYKHHEWYIRIMVEDKKDYLAALDYIADLDFCDAEYFVKKFGNILIQYLPDESTTFLQSKIIQNYSKMVKPIHFEKSRKYTYKVLPSYNRYNNIPLIRFFLILLIF